MGVSDSHELANPAGSTVGLTGPRIAPSMPSSTRERRGSSAGATEPSSGETEKVRRPWG